MLHEEPTRVRSFTALIVDHEPQTRAALITRLREFGAIDVAEATDVAQARISAGVGGPRDLCVLNLELPGGTLNLLADLRNAGWQRLVVLSAKADPFSVRAAFVAGAHSYMLKADIAATTEHLTPAGHRIPSPRLPARPEPLPSERAWRQLSAREIEVLRLVAAGQSNNAAGLQLQLSALTVKSHLARIARKLGTGDRAHMVAVAMRAGLIG
ncbi:MAG: response regulator transcription factor [Actinomycetota bacterium]|nr:response regulator transcription factor [Actinomycetota bacterium]